MVDDRRYWFVFSLILIGTFLSVLGIGSFSQWLESKNPELLDPFFLFGLASLFIGLGILTYGSKYYLDA